MAQISSKSQFLVRKPPFHSRIHDRGAGSRLRVLRIRPRSNCRSSSPVRRLVSSLQFANTSASQNQNRRWTLHARVASIVSKRFSTVALFPMKLRNIESNHGIVPQRRPGVLLHEALVEHSKPVARYCALRGRTWRIATPAPLSRLMRPTYRVVPDPCYRPETLSVI